jgi:hypothetical protein
MEYGCKRRNESFNEEVHVLFCTFTPLIFYELCGSRNFILDPVPVFWGWKNLSLVSVLVFSKEEQFKAFAQ